MSLALRDAINTGLTGSTSTTNSTNIANQVCCESDVFIICLFPWNPKQNVIQPTTGQYRECHGTHLEGGKAILDHLEHRLFGEAFHTLCISVLMYVVLEYTLVHCTKSYHNRGEQSGNDQSKQASLTDVHASSMNLIQFQENCSTQLLLVYPFMDNMKGASSLPMRKQVHVSAAMLEPTNADTLMGPLCIRKKLMTRTKWRPNMASSRHHHLG